MKISDTYPGIKYSEFLWEDGEGKLHRMEEMSLGYLKNVKKVLSDQEFFTGAEDYDDLKKKIAEVDKTIMIVNRECALAKIPKRLREKSSALDFDIRELCREEV